MNRLRQRWLDLRSTFWFIPALIILASVILAIFLIEANSFVGGDLLDRWPLLFGAGAAGSRQLLAVLATSMITVAGVVFSITIVALSLASNQYTSRVLRNFMRDRINQTVLGLFVGIFAYCLVVLRTIRAGDEGSFVPALAMLFALFLGLFGICVLIYFIHHIASSIQASQILFSVSAETLRAVDHLFPAGLGQESEETQPPLPGGTASWKSVPAGETGYIQSIDTRGLLDFAEENRCLLRVERIIGEFVIEGTPLFAYHSASALEASKHKQLIGLFSVGSQRTIEQDAAFGIRQLVDVALKALSPGINDTTTAVMCIDYLTAILVRLAGRPIESNYRSRGGELRVVTRGPNFEGLVADCYDQIRQNASGNVAVLSRLLWSIDTLASATSKSNRRQVLLDHALAIQELSHRTVPAPSDRSRLNAISSQVINTLKQTS